MNLLPPLFVLKIEAIGIYLKLVITTSKRHRCGASQLLLHYKDESDIFRE
jgi:hypothetical protein